MNNASIPAGTSISSLLQHANQPELSLQDKRRLITHALQLSRVQLITQTERLLTATEAQQLSDLFARRAAGTPLAYLLGTREFYGLELHVTPDVLIPRAETELLVDLALQRLPHNARVLELGTGSGAIAIALANARPDLAITALDLSHAALQVARGNAERHQVRIDFLQSDWYQTLSETERLANLRFDLIVANPPYIASDDGHLQQGDLRFEPLGALTDHADGLSALRIIIQNAVRYLQQSAWLLLEHGYDQAVAVRELFKNAGFCEVQSWRDLAGIERATGAQFINVG